MELAGELERFLACRKHLAATRAIAPHSPLAVALPGDVSRRVRAEPDVQAGVSGEPVAVDGPHDRPVGEDQRCRAAVTPTATSRPSPQASGSTTVSASARLAAGLSEIKSVTAQRRAVQ